MGRLNVQNPQTKLWRCFSTVVDNWVSDWMSENDYKEWLISEQIRMMREDFENFGLQPCKFYSYNDLVYTAAVTNWKNLHCDNCIEYECDDCFIYTNGWESYAKNYASNDILGIIPILQIPKETT